LTQEPRTGPPFAAAGSRIAAPLVNSTVGAARREAPDRGEPRAQRHPIERLSLDLAIYFARRPPVRVVLLWLGAVVTLSELYAHAINFLFGYRQTPTTVSLVTAAVTVLVSTPLMAFAMLNLRRLDRLRERRKESEARFRDGVDSMVDGFIIADQHDRVLLWNRAFTQLFPRLAARLEPGLSLTEISAILAEEYASSPSPASRARQAQHLVEAYGVLDTPSEEALGGRIIMMVHSRTSEGGTVSIYRDVTKRHQREAELAAAKADAEHASRAKSNFLANMSHELRTPLNAVIGYSEILLEDAQAEGRQELTADLKRINIAGQHLLSLVNNVLDLSKIEAGRMELETAPIELDRVLAEIVSTCQKLVESNGNVLVLEAEAGLGIISGDATKLRQVLLNLLSNAAKFTRNGRIGLAVRRERDATGAWISFAISDTGIGISAENLGKLFSDFTQADASIGNTYGGTGLGLALSRRLCRLMGGDITAASELGRGACFTLRVPAAHHAAARRIDATAEPQATG
jgi:signal transduction histidine kinase